MVGLKARGLWLLETSPGRGEMFGHLYFTENPLHVVTLAIVKAPLSLF